MYQLKSELKRRGKSPVGNKADLIASLRSVIEEEGIDFESWAVCRNGDDSAEAAPSESASQISAGGSIKSAVSVAEVARLRRMEECATRAGLEAKAKVLLERQELEVKMAELERKREILEITGAIAISEARAIELGKHENDTKTNHDIHEPKPICTTQTINTSGSEARPRRSDRSETLGVPDSSDSPTDSRDIAKALRQERERTAGLMRLPPVELTKFGGDVTEFPHFTRAFELKIASKLSTDEEKLFYLEQNMIPRTKPHDIVTACLYLDNGYQEAVDLLSRRYGTESALAAAFVDRFEHLRPLKSEDVEGLDKFALELLKCKNAFCVGSMAMSDPRTMRSISSKLPQHSQHRWRQRADAIDEGEGRAVNFEDLVKFVAKEARVATNPVFGNYMMRSNTKQSYSFSSSKKNQSNTIVARTQVKTSNLCFHCQDGKHEITDCSTFASLPHEEKVSIVRNSALCFACLKRGHYSADCRHRAHCSICERRHPTSMHVFDDMLGDKREQVNDEKRVTSCKISETNAHLKPALPIVPVVLHCGVKKEITFAFLDSGSTHSFISEELIERLKLQRLPRTKLLLTTVNKKVEIAAKLVKDTWLSDLNSGNILKLPQLFSLHNIPVDSSEFPAQSEISKWEHLRDIQLPDCKNVKVGLLLGSNAFLAMEPLQVIPSIGENSPFAVRTRYGWIVSGLRGTSASIPVTNCKTRIRTSEIQKIEQLIIQLYNKEHEESLHSCKTGSSLKDKAWEHIVHSSIRLIRGHYEVKLPIANEKLRLPNNKSMAASRLQAVGKRVKRDAKLASDYKLYMENMFENGFAEPVPYGCDVQNNGQVWYLPHHAVFHPQKPDKVRIVFDGAAKFQGVSLNDSLLQGPDQTNTLLNVLTRFRTDSVAFTADIENMFHQVHVASCDRDYLRFLWWKDGNPASEILEYRMTVHVFGATSSPSIACYALRKTAIDNRDNFSKDACTTIERNFYVDDLLKAVSDEQKALSLIYELMELCKQGGFSLKKLSSNSPTVVASIPPELRSNQLKSWTCDNENLPTERVLGVVWEPERDMLKMSLNYEGIVTRPMTRRGLLSAVGSLYDPIGMSCPSMLKGRLLLQDLTRLQVGWDEEVPLVKKQEWLAWLPTISSINDLSISRCFKPKDFGDVVSCQLHHFADASEVAYGTVSFIRLVNSAGRVFCSFLKGKLHLAPLKGATIPRLELMAATTAVRVCSLMSEAIDLELEHVFWTDSTTVLRYIANKSKRFHTFVANRLAVIHDGSKPEQWRYVSSADNPADDVTRGVQSERWLNGPSFLWRDRIYWPLPPSPLREVTEDDPEVKRTTRVFAVATALPDPIERLVSHYSRLYFLLRGIAWILLVIKTLRNKQHPGYVQGSVSLCVEDIQNAEKKIIQWVQQQNFAKEYQDMSSDRKVSKASQLIKLSPILQNGILRVGGRLANAAIPKEMKHPAIIPSRGHFTELLIQDAHESMGHGGRQLTLAKLRKRFWIIKGNSSVRRVLAGCQVCAKTYRQPESQKMADLPSDRLQALEPPFTRTGVDYFGPFYVAQGRSQVKRYGVIFTCLSIRAVHVEVAENLTADSFICALRRFIARRGHVQVLISDRGTNFIGANRELRLEMAKQSDSGPFLQSTMLKRGIDWKFNVPGASHHGGVWERQIRSIRRVLESVLTSQPLRDETLRTLLCEIESILNSRPLTPISSDVRDDPPLSPNDLLLHGGQGVTLPITVFSQTEGVNKKRWKQAIYLANAFWKRWRAEYLPTLQERQKMLTLRKNLQQGDTVLLVDDTVPRGQWPLGLVEAVRANADGLVRSATIRTRGTIVERPVTKLVKLN